MNEINIMEAYLKYGERKMLGQFPEHLRSEAWTTFEEIKNYAKENGAYWYLTAKKNLIRTVMFFLSVLVILNLSLYMFSTETIVQKLFLPILFLMVALAYIVLVSVITHMIRYFIIFRKFIKKFIGKEEIEKEIFYTKILRMYAKYGDAVISYFPEKEDSVREIINEIKEKYRHSGQMLYKVDKRRIIGEAIFSFGTFIMTTVFAVFSHMVYNSTLPFIILSPAIVLSAVYIAGDIRYAILMMKFYDRLEKEVGDGKT